MKLIKDILYIQAEFNFQTVVWFELGQKYWRFNKCSNFTQTTFSQEGKLCVGLAPGWIHVCVLCTYLIVSELLHSSAGQEEQYCDTGAVGVWVLRVFMQMLLRALLSLCPWPCPPCVCVHACTCSSVYSPETQWLHHGLDLTIEKHSSFIYQAVQDGDLCLGLKVPSL